MAFLEGIDEWMFGDFRANRQRVEERHSADMERMQALLDSQAGQTLLTKARAASLDRGEGLYGGRGVDPYVKGSEDLGKIRKARGILEDEDEKLAPEMAAYFNAAEKSVLDRMNRGKRAEDRFDFVGPPAPTRRTDVRRPEPEIETSKSAAEYFQPVERDLRLEGQLPVSPDKGMFDRLEIGDYFQAPTDTVPESNIPKTYPQLGIESVDDMAILEEMQKALPEVDMRDEYESDPEMMKKLMELWRAKKLTKQNLHKAFSQIQQSAQQALGIG